ncbi:MAG TPA: ATP-binding protein [Terriglobales bacterium]|nr:ATP-binding protein [Terriglobales bacterium]
MSGASSWLYGKVGLRRVLLFLALVSVLVIGVLAQEARHPPKRVLILYAFDNEEGIYTDFDHVLRSQLRSGVRERVEFYTEYLDLIRFPAPAHAADLVKLLRMKYFLMEPDLIVPVSYSATAFLLRDGKDLFPNRPAVALFNVRRLDDFKKLAAAAHRSITGVADTDEPTRTLDLALRLQPDTQHVAVVVGNSVVEDYWFYQLLNDFSLYRDKVDFTYLNRLSMQELLAQVAQLPPHTVILATIYFEDANGQFFLQEEAVDLITRQARVPVYATHSSYLGRGVVGGHTPDPERIGEALARQAVPVLNGADAGSMPIVVDNSAQDTVDWRQLRRWSISERRLPPATVQLFREPSTWERYRWFIIAVLSLFVLETVLIVALVVNVGRRRQAERALQREKALADAIIESLPGIFFLQDSTGNNVRWNKNLQKVARQPDKMVVLGSIAEPDRPAVQRAREEVFHRGSSQVEAQVVDESGRTAPFYITGKRVDLEGKPYLAAVGIDLTETKRAQEAVRRSEAELRSFVENAPYGIGTISVKQDRFLRANPAMVRLLGCKSEAEVLALVISRDLYCDSDSFRAQPTRADFFSSVEFTWKRKDGKPVHVRASGRRTPGTAEQGDLIQIIAEDVTARRLLEEQLRHAQKMEALGQLAGSVAHDFNNLLGVIIGYSELLSNEWRGESRKLANLEAIKRAGQSAVSLTAQLLAFSRRQVLQPSVINLNSLVRETEKMLRRLMGEDIEQKSVLDPALGKTRADPGQLVQVIMNLAVNARDAMPHGGKLTIETANVTFADVTNLCDVEVPAGRYVRLSVSDTGEGMSPETRLRIFEPFFTTKGPGKGTGLGLATVYGIVKQSGGYIFAESELGKGATFNVYLPCVDQVAEATAAAVAPQDLPQRSETILVVEDEPAFLSVLRDALQSRGYRVLAAANGAEALHVAEQHAGPIHLLITDVIMPQMSGPELAKCLREVRGNTDVLYMSGYTDDKVHGIAAVGELRLIQKPFRIHELEQKMEAILARKGAESVPGISGRFAETGDQTR